jgi:hypothetical protein
MGSREIELLGLSVSQVEAAVAFYESYANTVTGELEQYRSGTVATSRRAVADPAQEEGDDHELALLTDLTSALREAAQWATLLDPARPLSLLRRAGELTAAHGPGFSAFLLTVSDLGDDDARNVPTPSDPAVYARNVSMLRNSGPERQSDEPVPGPMRHPQQQAYLLLSLAALQRPRREHRGTLREFIAGSPHRDGVTPVGPLGIPIRVYWDIARLMLSNTELRPVVRHLTAMAGRYADRVELARTNTHLWEHAAAPVDVGNVDMSCLAVLADMSFGHRRFRPALARAIDDQDTVFAVPLRLAVEMSDYAAESRGDSDDGPWLDDHDDDPPGPSNRRP